MDATFIVFGLRYLGLEAFGFLCPIFEQSLQELGLSFALAHTDYCPQVPKLAPCQSSVLDRQQIPL